MEEVCRYPLDIEDETDSDCEIFKLPDQPQIVYENSHKRKRVKEINPRGNSWKGIRPVGEQAVGSTSTSTTSAALDSVVLRAGFSQLEAVPRGGSRAMQKRHARLQRAKTSGAGWFNMAAPEMTDDVKQNLELLQMRSAVDKNRVYKKNDMKVLPKYFAMGTVVEHAADFYSSRIPQKQRKKTLVEELMADAEAKKRLKKTASKLAVKKKLQAQNGLPRKNKLFKKHTRRTK